MGIFLKKPNQAELLTGIGRDENNYIFPVAWAVVNVENKDNWTWFLEVVASDLEVEGGVGLTLMSDQHKGKQFSGVKFRNLFWAASKTSYHVMFDTIMENIKAANLNAFKYLTYRNPESWSMAFFVVDRGCEAVENGFSECFNSVIVMCRHKLIITMLEAIMVIIMERMNVMRMLSEHWVGDIAPNIVKKLEVIKDQHRYWQAHFAGGFEYEVRHKTEAYKVDKKLRTCSCKLWQLSGIPCLRACSVIFALNKSPEDYIPAWFRKEMYMRAYSTYLRPVGGMSTWVPNQLNKPLSPKPKAYQEVSQRKEQEHLMKVFLDLGYQRLVHL
ncbi:uncharacterized protein [Rutidosis leptorrhynchoides]|uniref:uncharacterized protein n=1 Tax=Rutidosis leptorrhynchoides TaxID=125765 RepID=UPI003A991016